MTTRHPYYNYDKLYSYNGVYNFLVGGRGLGKTYGAKKKAIKAAIEKDDEFIYLRRYKSELIASKNTFFADIKHEFPLWEFKTNGSVALGTKDLNLSPKEKQWKILGYFVSLSTAQTQKSVAFPKVKLIIFDEFIIETGLIHYLRNEATIFTNFYSTVDRYTDKTKVLFLANSVSIMNPYFIEYEIRPDQESEFYTSHKGFIVCHFPSSKDFQKSVYNTIFGKFIQDTEYSRYAVANQFTDNHNALLGDKDPKMRYVFTVECQSNTFSVWQNYDTDNYFVQTKRPKVEFLLTLVPSKHASDKILITYNDRVLQSLRTAFRQARVTFDKPGTRNTFAEIFKR